jgi:hypothetical protein
LRDPVQQLLAQLKSARDHEQRLGYVYAALDLAIAT